MKQYPNVKTGILFSGAVGCGKTHLAVAIAHEVIEAKEIDRRRAVKLARGISLPLADSVPVRVITTIDLFQKLRATFGTDKSDADILDEYKKTKLLLLDDFEVEKASEWVEERLYEIIDYRYKNQLATICTTNNTQKELREKIGVRTYVRIRAMCRHIQFTAGSQRVTA